MTTPPSRASDVLAPLDPALRRHARRVLEWLAPDGDIDEVSDANMLYFVWYQLPTKWFMPLGEMADVARATAEVVRLAGRPRIADLIYSAQTAKIHGAWHDDRNRAARLVQAALAGSGVEPPDTDVLTWGTVMEAGEARARFAAAKVLEKAIDDGVFTPGRAGWRRIQANLTEAWLTTPSLAFGGTTPVDMIHAERRAAWTRAQSPAHRTALAPVLPLLDVPPPAAVGESEVLRWLLEQVAEGVTLTQAGYLPTAMAPVAAKRWFDDWMPTGSRPRSEADLLPLTDLRELAQRARLLTKRGRKLTVSAAGKVALTDPARLAHVAATTWFGPNDFVAAAGEVAAAGLLQRHTTAEELSASVWAAITPTFRDKDGERPSQHDTDTAFHEWRRFGVGLGYVDEGWGLDEPDKLTPSGRVAAIVGLRERAHGPRKR